MYDLKINSKLSHLSIEEIDTLVKRYYEGENTNKLIEEYSIDTTTSNLYKLFPPIVNNDILCPYCKVPMITIRKARSSYQSEESVCPKCNHNNAYCRCSNCLKTLKEKEMQERDKKRKKINIACSLDNLVPIVESEISFRERVYLGALLRAGMAEDYSIILPYSSFNVLLAPSEKYSLEIINALYHNFIIAVHPNSPIEGFKPGDDFPKVFYPAEVLYHVNLISSIDRKEMINRLINPPDDISVPPVEAFELWKDIAIDECLDYLVWSMNKVGFEFNPADKTIDTISDLLTNFSTSQIFYIIYHSISKAVRYYQENNIPKKQAANSVISNCRKYGEKVVSENWDIKGYRRDMERPESMLSEFYFNRVLKIGEKGFYEKPQINTIMNFQNVKNSSQEDINEKINNILNKGSNNKLAIYKFCFYINKAIENGLQNPGYTSVRAINEAEARENVLAKIAKVYEVSLEDIIITKTYIEEI